jgi:hypothetical protein
MGKFKSTLTASDSKIKATRAANVELVVKMEVEDLVRKLTKEKLALSSKIDNLTDLGPDTSTSLRPTSKDFNAAKWVSELHEATLDLDLKDIELLAAKEILKEWFADEEEV